MTRQKKQNPESEWFGYEKTDPSAKTAKVRGVFDSVAENYDLMNDMMSGGIHRLWKNHLIRRIRPRPADRLLDVAGGTGDIAFKFMAKAGDNADVTVCDINPEMLKVGRKRALDRGITGGIKWIEGNAEKLPFEDDSFDVYTIAFGLRNVTRIDDALADAFRVLKPGGRFYCMEFSTMPNPVLAKLYDLYSFNVIPKLGDIIANDADSYQYLVESIRQFPKQNDLAARMEDAGFTHVRFENLTGGIAAIHSGYKL